MKPVLERKWTKRDLNGRRQNGKSEFFSTVVVHLYTIVQMIFYGNKSYCRLIQAKYFSNMINLIWMMMWGGKVVAYKDWFYWSTASSPYDFGSSISINTHDTLKVLDRATSCVR